MSAVSEPPTVPTSAPARAPDTEPVATEPVMAEQVEGIIPIPVESSPTRPQHRKDVASPQTAEDVTDSQTAEGPVGAADDPPDAQSGAAASPTTGPANWGSLFASLSGLWYAVVDRLLWAINRPFERLSPDRRQLIGFAALATIFVSLFALFVFPLLCPRHDVYTQITRSREAALARKTAPSAPPAKAAQEPPKSH